MFTVSVFLLGEWEKLYETHILYSQISQAIKCLKRISGITLKNMVIFLCLAKNPDDSKSVFSAARVEHKISKFLYWLNLRSGKQYKNYKVRTW